MRIDELPPFNLHIAELMRLRPAGAHRPGRPQRPASCRPKSKSPATTTAVVRWVQHQWDALWHGAAHQLLRAKLFGFLPFEVVYRRAAGGEFRGLIEVERLIDHHPATPGC